MTKNQIIKNNEVQYSTLISNIGELLQKARSIAYQQVNTLLVKTYREIGKYIVEYEQWGKEKAEYGTKLFDKMSRDLKDQYGKGFSRSNLMYIRLLYLKYPISETLSHQLNWSHYFELLKIADDLERSFYERQIVNEKRSVRELIRNKNSALFQRLALSKDKDWVLKLAKKWHEISESKDVVRDPCVLEFLGIEQDSKYSESDLEQTIINNLQKFIMELGKWFAFVGRQYRIPVWNKHFYVDLVFYHRILKCFVLIDLKIKEVDHADVGQMNLYLNYFKKEEMTEWDNEPIGIILTAEKDSATVEYALWGITNQLFISKYQLYLPDKKLLQEKLDKIVSWEE